MVKVVGWGTEKNEMDEEADYWLIDPMWGNEFGDNGLVKVERNSEELFLDKWGVTFYPDN